MTKTKAELLAMIQALPDDATLWVEATQGMHEEAAVGGFRHHAPNGTRTLTIYINGGTWDTRTGLMAQAAKLCP